MNEIITKKMLVKVFFSLEKFASLRKMRCIIYSCITRWP